MAYPGTVAHPAQKLDATNGSETTLYYGVGKPNQNLRPLRKSPTTHTGMLIPPYVRCTYACTGQDRPCLSGRTQCSASCLCR